MFNEDYVISLRPNGPKRDHNGVEQNGTLSTFLIYVSQFFAKRDLV